MHEHLSPTPGYRVLPQPSLHLRDRVYLVGGRPSKRHGDDSGYQYGTK